MTSEPIHADRVDAALVRRLVDDQFPRWRHLPLRPVEHSGNDHRIFRLGDGLSVRLPSAPGYVPQVEKEQTWLPRLAPELPLPIPTVEGIGTPSDLFPAPWTVYRWMAGTPASRTDVPDWAFSTPQLAAERLPREW